MQKTTLKHYLLPLFLLIFFGILSSPVQADFQIPEKPEGYVVDPAGLLSSDARQNLEIKLREFEQQTSNQVVVATFSSLEGGSLEDISLRIAEKWKIGQKKSNNGVLFLVFRDDRQMRIETGYGLEGVLTDALSAQIIRNEVVPYFRNKDYQSGILRGVNAIFAATQGEYKGLPAASEENGSSAWTIFIFVIFLLIFVTIINRTTQSKQGWTSSRNNNWGGGGFGGGGGGGFSGGGGGFGGGGSSGRW